MSRYASPVSVIESLEIRRLMAATITGAVMKDVTGNGLSADDVGLAGVVVNLYKDKNANGIVDAADGGAVATRTSAAGTGAFSFPVAAKGKYLLQEVVGANQVRTGPFLTDTIAVNVTKTTKKSVYGGNLFANYVKDFDKTSVTGIKYSINGGAPVSTMDGNVHQGDTVTVTFTVPAGKMATVTFVSYKAPEPVSTAENLQFQELYQSKSGTFAPGTHSLTVDVPDCYFQLDFVGGLPIDPFGPAGSDILYARQGRRIAFVNGGDEPCDCDVPPVCEPPPCEPPPCEPPPCVPPPVCEPPPCAPPPPPPACEPKPCEPPPCNEQPKPRDEREDCDDDKDRDDDKNDRNDKCDDDKDKKGGKSKKSKLKDWIDEKLEELRRGKKNRKC